MCYIFEVFYLKYRITFLEDLPEEERNASQSSDYYYKERNQTMTSDLSMSGEPDDALHNGTCYVTLANPSQSVACWMFTFPVDTVFITNVKKKYRSLSNCSYQLI